MSGRLRILEIDPDLGRALEAYEMADARERCTGRRLQLLAGRWEPAWASEEWADCLGLLIVSGGMMERARLGSRQSTELLGPGDVLQPWSASQPQGVLAPSSEWRVYDDTLIAVLDRRFVQTSARWPEVSAAIVDRVLERTKSLSLRLAIAQMPRLSERVLYALWHLAERWGRVDREGVLVPVALSHQLIAEFVCAQRPSVSHAMRDLSTRGLVTRTDDGHWRLHGGGPSALADAAVVHAA